MDVAYVGLIGVLGLSLLGLSYGCEVLRRRGGAA